MSQLLRAVGFPVHSDGEFRALCEVASRFGKWHKFRDGYHIHWGPDRGVEFWGRTDRRRRPLGGQPHFLGTGRVWMTVERVIPGESRMEGVVVGRVDPEAREGGGPRLVVALPDYGMTGPLLDSENLVAKLQVAAFAEKLACFPDEADFARRAGRAAEVDSIRPLGAAPEARARVAGRIESAETRHNAMSGDPFWVLSVRVRDNWVDVVADPKDVRGRPEVGGIVVGNFFLSGQAIPETRRKRFGLPPVDRPGHDHPDIAVKTAGSIVGLDEAPKDQVALKAVHAFFLSLTGLVIMPVGPVALYRSAGALLKMRRRGYRKGRLLAVLGICFGLFSTAICALFVISIATMLMQQ